MCASADHSIQVPNRRNIHQKIAHSIEHILNALDKSIFVYNQLVVLWSILYMLAFNALASFYFYISHRIYFLHVDTTSAAEVHLFVQTYLYTCVFLRVVFSSPSFTTHSLYWDSHFNIINTSCDMYILNTRYHSITNQYV